ncbi:hypothetical protein D1872_290550 [compost metagenome]
MPDSYIQQTAAVHDLEPQTVPRGRQGGRKRQHAVAEQAESGKAVHHRHPRSAHRGGVQAVFYIPVHVVQIHPHRAVEIFVRLFQPADLGGDDAVNAGRQGGIMGRQRFVVPVIAYFIRQ